MLNRPLPITDHSGGFTDNYIDGGPTKCRKNDNLVITSDRHLLTRDGSTIYNSSFYQVPDGAVRLGTLLAYDRSDTVLYHYGRKFYYINAAWVNLTGPTGNQVFDTATTDHYVIRSEWKKQLYVTNNAATTSVNSFVHKIYRNESGALTLRTAGLPKVADTANFVEATVLASLITLANEIRSDLITHLAVVSTNHTAAHASASAIITSGAATDLATLLVLIPQLLSAYESHFNDSVRSSPIIHILKTPTTVDANFPIENTANAALESIETPETYNEIADRLNDLKLRFNLHVGDSDIHGGDPVGGETSAAYVRTATYGPYISLDVSSLYRTINLFKAAFNSHIAKVGAAAAHNNIAAQTAVAAADATDDATFTTLLLAMIIAFNKHVTDNDGDDDWHDGVPADMEEDQIYATIFNTGDSWAGAPEGYYERQAAILNELVSKYNHHQADQVPHQNDAAYTNLDPLRAGDFEFGAYLYAFHYEVSYFVGSVEYIDQGPTLVKSFPLLPSLDMQEAVIAGIPVFTNAATQNYPTATMRVRIARTTDGGTEFYYVGSVVNGTTTFTDRTTDARLVTGEQLYTAGGVVDNDPPPMCKTLHIVDNVGYYGNCIADGEAFPNRVYQSIANDPDSVPADFFDDLEEPVTIVTSAASRPIAICTTKTYRLDGGFDEQGRGALTHEKISDVGSECPQSAVQAEGGVFFAGNDGFYFCDGFQVKPISTDWPTTFKAWTSTEAKRNHIQGTFDEKERKIYWTVQTDDASGDCDSVLVLDLRYGVREDSSFSTWSNSTYFRPTSILFFGGNLLRGDTRGYTFKHASGVKADPRINTSQNPSLWGKKAIIYNFISNASSFGQPKLLKFIPTMEVVVKNNGNLSLQPKSINNDKGESAAVNLRAVRFRGQYTGLIREEFTFPAGSLRSSYKQIQLTNATVIVTNSDTLGNASVNNVAKTVTLDSAVTQDWPADALDWLIYFASDNYVTGYTVTARTDDTLTFSDAGNTSPSGSVKWVLKGVPKDETFELIAYNLNLQIPSGDNLKANQTSEAGANV